MFDLEGCYVKIKAKKYCSSLRPLQQLEGRISEAVYCQERLAATELQVGCYRVTDGTQVTVLPTKCNYKKDWFLVLFGRSQTFKCEMAEFHYGNHRYSCLYDPR